MDAVLVAAPESNGPRLPKLRVVPSGSSTWLWYEGSKVWPALLGQNLTHQNAADTTDSNTCNYVMAHGETSPPSMRLPPVDNQGLLPFILRFQNPAQGVGRSAPPDAP